MESGLEDTAKSHDAVVVELNTKTADFETKLIQANTRAQKNVSRAAEQ